MAAALSLSDWMCCGVSGRQICQTGVESINYSDRVGACVPEPEPGQRVPDVDSAGQQLRLKERRFFEEVFQHDVDMYLSSAHLTIREHRRPPIGSISSMEVNVDLLDQMDLIDISDQDAFDVFFSSGEESMLNSPLPGQAPGGNNNNNNPHGEVANHGLFRHVLEGLDAKSRVSSTSSESSTNSQSPAANGNGRSTPVVLSDEEEEEQEETQGNAAVYGATPTERGAAKTPPPSTSS
ncbi:Dysbindin [Merluccius polli]|uniref:Dysbindin n=1 Tax=Merluccius polli TaxID=89951 RepID=A0AA47P6X3_MERPO|nr:Dysbindin [Merluccius polli]